MQSQFSAKRTLAQVARGMQNEGYIMELLSVATIRQRLDDQFLPLEPALTGLRLIESAIPSSRLRLCEKQLGVTFPESFVKNVTHFDFGRFTVGPVAFCNTGDYFAWLTTINDTMATHGYPWWGSGERPSEFVMIANSDPYAILLNTKVGNVLALLHGESWRDSGMNVATDFEYFVRGLGTVMLERNSEGRNKQLANDVALAVGVQPGNAFWLHMAG